MISKNQKIFVLHGWTDQEQSINNWQKFNQELKNLGLDVQFLRLPLLLDKNDLVEKPWHLHDYVNWLNDKLKKETSKNEEVLLLGHSFGGQISLKYLADFNSANGSDFSVKKLILIDSAGLVDKSLEKILKRKIFYFLTQLFKPFKKFSLLRAIVYRIIGERDYYKANELQQKTMSNVINYDLNNELNKIKVPTLIIWGALDQVTPVFMAKTFLKKIKKSQLFLIKGAKHSPQFTHLQETIEIIKDNL